MITIYDSNILLVDDNGQLLEMVTDILKKDGFKHIETAGGCEACLRQCDSRMPDLILLDIGLPDGDGFSLMNEIRLRGNVPVLFLSARDEDSDRLLGLGLGADDYITKPFLPRELVLRVSAVLKRTYFPPAPARQNEEDILILGNYTVNFSQGTVKRSDGEESGNTDIRKLTAKEITILKKLNENRGRIVTFDSLSQAVWGEFYYGYENSLMVHIRRLREKIEENPSSPRYLTTVRGLGYKLERSGG